MRRSVVAVFVALAAVAGPLAGTGCAASAARSTDVRTVSPASFGAVGDGVTDDTAALQRSFDALRPGDTLAFGEGKVYRHTDILQLRVPDVRVHGPATLLATNEARSEVLIDADRVTFDDLTLKMQATTRRWDTFEQMKLRLEDHTGIVVQNVIIDGSAAAGVYVRGAADFTLQDLTVRDTRADGIHITGDSHDGTVSHPTVDRSGDDGVAVVSYRNDGTPVRRVLIDHPTVRNNTWGRGISVVGGEDITYSHVKVKNSSSAAVYIASEGGRNNTFAPVRIKIEGAVLKGSNTAAAVDHGAFLVYSGNPGSPPTDVEASGVQISRTRAGASSQVGIRADNGCTVAAIRLSTFTVTGGGNVFSANTPNQTFVRSGWLIG